MGREFVMSGSVTSETTDEFDLTCYESRHKFSSPGLQAHLQSSNWTDFEESLENEFRCLVHTDVEELIDEHEKGLSATTQSYDKNETKYGNIQVSVCMGDIRKDNSCVIINGTTTDFDLERGRLSLALLEKAGREMQTQCRNSPFLSETHIRVTNGWELKSDFVIHIVAPDDMTEFPERILSALKYADMMAAVSVAMPAIGTGAKGLDPAEVASSMSKAFELFAAEIPESVRKIKVYILRSADLFLIFKSCITYNEVEPFGKTKALMTKRNANCSVTVDNVVIHVTSATKDCLDEAVRRLDCHMAMFICELKIWDVIVSRLDNHDCIDIYEAAQKYEVSVKYMQHASGFVLLGMKENVNKLYKLIGDILNEYRNAEMKSPFFMWKLTNLPGSFNGPLPLRVSNALEDEYTNNDNKRRTFVFLSLYGSILSVDFPTMTYQFCRTTGKLERESIGRFVMRQRLDIAHGLEIVQFPLPLEWCPMGADVWMRVLLTPGTEEYERMCMKFMDDSTMFHVFRIYRVQNPWLYQRYMRKKEFVKGNMTTNEPVERELFHGTNVEAAEKICSEGFDRSFAKRTKYGKGTYFAEKSSHASMFSVTDKATNEQHVLLCRVLTGDFCMGNSNMLLPPLKDSRSGVVLYDCAVNDLRNPSIFVTFQNDNAYPHYLISFKTTMNARVLHRLRNPLLPVHNNIQK